jgi:hypothetical protein
MEKILKWNKEEDKNEKFEEKIKNLPTSYT